MYCHLNTCLTASQAEQLRTELLPGNWRYRVPCTYGIGYARLTPTPDFDFPVRRLVVDGDRDQLTLPAAVNFVFALKPRPDSSYDFRFSLPHRRPTGPWSLAVDVTQALATLGVGVTLGFPTLTHQIRATLPAATAPALAMTTAGLCQAGHSLWHRPQAELRTDWQQIITRGRYQPDTGWGPLLQQITYLFELATRSRPFEQLRRDRRRITEYWAYTLGR